MLPMTGRQFTDDGQHNRTDSMLPLRLDGGRQTVGGAGGVGIVVSGLLFGLVVPSVPLPIDGSARVGAVEVEPGASGRLPAAGAKVHAGEAASAVIIDIHGDVFRLRKSASGADERTRLHLGSTLAPGDRVVVDGLEGKLTLYFADGTVPPPHECRADVPCATYEVPPPRGVIAKATHLGQAIFQRFTRDAVRYVPALARSGASGVRSGDAGELVVEQDDVVSSLRRILSESSLLPAEVTLRPLSASATRSVSLEIHSGVADASSRVEAGLYVLQLPGESGPLPNAVWLLVVPASRYRDISSAFSQCKEAVGLLEPRIPAATGRGLRRACLDEVRDEFDL